MKLKHLKTTALYILVASNVFAATNTLHDKTEKTSPSVNDETYIWDVTDSTLKKSTTGNLPISTATQTALNGKANASAFASQAAFTAAWGWTLGGISAWSDIQALLTGTGAYVKADGTTGDPDGALPTGTEGQTVQYGSGGTPAAVDMAPLTFVGSNISYNTTTGVVSVPVTATATSGSAVPFTSGGAYTALGGKENADATIVKSGEIDTQEKFEALTGWALPSSGGTGGYVSLSAAPYSDVACTTGQYGYYGSTAYLCTGGFWTSKWTLTSHSNPTPATYSLTITPSGFTGADKFTYNSTDYTTEQTITGLSADVNFTVTPDTGRAIACTGAELTDNTGGSYTANTDTANVVATCTSSAVATTYTPIATLDSNTAAFGLGLNDFRQRIQTRYTPGSSTTITKTSFFVYKLGSIASKNIKGEIYADNGSGKPGALLATSINTVSTDSFSGTNDATKTKIEFIYTGVSLSSGTPYWSGMSIDGYGDVSNYVKVAGNSSSTGDYTTMGSLSVFTGADYNNQHAQTVFYTSP